MGAAGDMTPCTRQAAAAALLAALSLLLAACTTLQGEPDEGEASFESMEAPAPQDPESPATEETAPEALGTEGEVPLAVAESESPEISAPEVQLDAIVVSVTREDQIRDLVSQARELLEDHELQYVFTGKGRNETLRGRPVAFALWSESDQAWTVARIEIPATDKLEAGRQAHEVHPAHPGHQGAAHQGHGRRATDVRLLEGRRAAQGVRQEVPGVRRRAAQEEALAGGCRNREAHRLPALHGRHLRSRFVSGGRDFLLATAQQAIEELRLAKAPRSRFLGSCSPMSCPPPSSRRSQ